MRWITGDSFEILPALDEGSFDLILTDPPYDFTEGHKAFLHTHFMRIAKRGVIVFAPPENQWVQPAHQHLFWMKPTSTKNTSRRYSRFVEMIFLYGSLKWNSGLHWSQYTNIFTDLVDRKDLHPYRKPLSLIQRLMLIHSDPGDTILDPFAGSGVVGEVGDWWDRDVTLIDIEEPDYV